MESRTQILGIPVHELAVMFPIGALGFSTVSDALHTATGKRKYATAARQAINFGLAAAAVAAPFGLIDWLAIEPGTKAKRVGTWHAVGNLAVLGLFAAGRVLRSGRKAAPSSAKFLSAAGFLLSGVTIWAGVELVNRHKIGVHDNAGVNARGSLE